MVPRHQGHCWNQTQCLDKIQVFWENQFFVFLGPRKTFWNPKNLIWPQKPNFWGVHQVSSSISYFWHNLPYKSSNPGSDQKLLEVWQKHRILIFYSWLLWFVQALGLVSIVALVACRKNQKLSQIKLLTLPFSHKIQVLMIGTSVTTSYCPKTLR